MSCNFWVRECPPPAPRPTPKLYLNGNIIYISRQMLVFPGRLLRRYLKLLYQSCPRNQFYATTIQHVRRLFLFACKGYSYISCLYLMESLNVSFISKLGFPTRFPVLHNTFYHILVSKFCAFKPKSLGLMTHLINNSKMHNFVRKYLSLIDIWFRWNYGNYTLNW